MTKVTGKLVKQGKNFMVNLPSKKGTANHPIPEAAKRYADGDAEDGLEVEVEKDAANRIVSVTIPGKSVVQPTVTQARRDGRGGSHRGRGGPRQAGRAFGNQQTDRGKLPKAPASVLGQAFHNPYTFIPFPASQPQRQEPTLHSVDEAPNSGRFCGVLRLRVTTLSPLLSCNPEPKKVEHEHKYFDALTIGNDVIVPATGIRGALRTLLTIITGGTLGYLNTEEILCQGRDVNLGPKGTNSPDGTPEKPHMAEVLDAGTSRRSGTVRMGRVTLVSAEELQRHFRDLDKHRKPGSRPLWVELNNQGKVSKVMASQTCPSSTAGRLRLSGRPVNKKGKREAVFFPTTTEFQLPPAMWADYGERHKHGDRATIKTGDLVWLMPADPSATALTSPDDVASIQWARWGRKGQKLKDVVEQHHRHILPDNMRSDGTVDTVTDLFGQIPLQRGSNAPAFAARVMPDNLVFYDTKNKVKLETLAPLAQPHPGCLAFYRQSGDPDNISANDPLSGYKVYRTTDAMGDDAPWLFKNQGIYGDAGELKDTHSNMNKSCELLPVGQSGELNLSFTALSKLELALLMQACSVPWRLGGGKPLGLGRCVVAIAELIDELGSPLTIDGWTSEVQPDGTLGIDGWQNEVQRFADRVVMWQASQKPVPLLRYPRAVEDTNYKKSRGGHVWFARNAQPRAGDKDGQRKVGLNPIYIDGSVLQNAQRHGATLDSHVPMIAAQPLPPLDVNDTASDALFGYDLYSTKVERRERPRRNVFWSFEPIDQSKHVTGHERSSGNHGKDKDFRDRSKKRD